MSPPASVVRVAAIDLGKARVGIAVSDDLGLLAHPRPFLDGKNRKPLVAALVAMVREEGIQKFLLGLPLEMTGEEGPAARRILSFAQELANASGVEIELVDERLTTVEAAQQLRASGISAREGKGLVDGVSAAVILQSWLDARRDRDADDDGEDYRDDDA
jgi:putative Holliday junction resolvase